VLGVGVVFLGGFQTGLLENPFPVPALGGDPLDLLAARLHLRAHRGVPRLVDPLLHRDDRREVHLVDLLAPRDLPLGGRRPVLDVERLDAGHAGDVEFVRHAHADLVVPRVGGFVAEQQQVEPDAVVGPPADGVGDRPRRRPRPPRLAPGLQQRRPVGLHR